MFIIWLGFIKKTLKLSATLCFAGVVFALYLLFTSHGSQILIAIISETSPYQIEYQQFSGYLARQADFQGLKITGPNLQVHASALHARWDLVDLLQPTKTIQFLEAEGLDLEYHGKKMPSDAASSLLPFPFVVENLSLKDAHFQINQEQHNVNRLDLKRASSNDINSIQEIHYIGTFGQLDVILNTAIEAKWDLHFKDAPFFAPYLSGKVNSKGTILLPKRKWRDPSNQIQITIEGERAELESYSINNYTLNLQGTLAKHRASLNGRMKAIPFSTAIKGKLIPTGWQGSIEELLLHQSNSDPVGNSSGKLNIDWSQNEILANLKLMLGEKLPIDANISVKKDKNRTLTGTISTDIKQLRSLSNFFPELRRVRGSASAQVKLSGKINNILLSGNMLFTDLRITAPVLKSKAVIQSLEIKVSEKQILTASGQGTFGSGIFSINGEGTLKGVSPNLTVHLKGEQLLLSDTPEYYIVGNPDLTLTLQNSGAYIKGKILVPHAEIRSFKNMDTIKPSEDVILISKRKIADKPAPTYSLSHQLRTNIDIILGDKILYEGYGFKTQAQGQLNIKQSPGQPTKARGKINLVKGKYRAYRKRFDIAEGELLYTGGVIDNPTLNIRAERKIKTNPAAKSFHTQSMITAGVKFAGPLKEAHMEFYSSPTMSNADIISYLVVGQPQSKMNQAQAELIFEALSHLTMLTGNKRSDVQFDLAEQLKLDQFGFSTKENSLSTNSRNPLEDTVLVMGKQLSDKLYLHYSLGLVDSSNSFGLKYFMNKNVTIEASTGTEGTSADLLLTFEGH